MEFEVDSSQLVLYLEGSGMKKEYKKPEFKSHEPLKIVSGTGATTDDDDTGGGNGGGGTSYWY